MWRKILTKEHSPFDFINAVSHNKKDLIGDSDYPDLIEKEYNPYIVNRGLSFHQDTILHANEMNQRSHVFNRAQFDYYRAVLRSRKRFSKWHKADKDADLDALQHVYNCNRTVAKMYLKTLTEQQMQYVHSKMETGGDGKK